jgi:hypothetical protein
MDLRLNCTFAKLWVIGPTDPKVAITLHLKISGLKPL